ncbi:Fpg/Nei family DNA glycosylase [Cryptosporangium phraense]|uniref:DNA-(apurinic or apyrimidinic site) lyase n=1 Tax=Cryptosporangium phraense TaxID=2593070 RepID=A0A545AU20_9ACTN|nr:DNA-formamidopyrimidine glycosylase family protein [Cryptosporangium phraense]TQS44828.1 Fpg/Nei family DNA glycosylase [Cryptosporangium phraense]
MPEGDVVFRTAARLHAALAGQRIVKSDLRHPRLALVDLSGRTVTEAVPRGKHLLIRFTGGLTLHSHLKMDGNWWIYRPGQRWRSPGHQVRVVLTTEAVVAVGSRLHDLEVIATDNEPSLVGHLGPDLLGPDWDADEAVRRLRTNPQRPIGLALLDQRNLAGIGNLYRAEVLFLRGVHPETPTGEVADLPAMMTIAHRLLYANRERVEQSTTGSLIRGQERYAYGRRGRPCLRCGTRIQAGPLGSGAEGTDAERTVFWCPKCQPRD